MSSIVEVEVLTPDFVAQFANQPPKEKGWVQPRFPSRGVSYVAYHFAWDGGLWVVETGRAIRKVGDVKVVFASCEEAVAAERARVERQFAAWNPKPHRDISASEYARMLEGDDE